MTDTLPFRPLGYDNGSYFYLITATGQVEVIRGGQHGKATLRVLAPTAWWEAHYGSERGVSWDAAADACLRMCERAGVFSHERLHGRGAWATEAGLLMHLGDRLRLYDGTEVDPPSYDADMALYERRPKLIGKWGWPMATEDSAALVKLIERLRWIDHGSGILLAGWLAFAPLCGALPWRPHVFLTGGSGSGKTTILERIVVPLLGDVRQYFRGATTEAGIRQTLMGDALPVVVDEAEADEEKQAQRVQSILSLARDSSSETQAKTVKGTVSGAAMGFRIRSMFLLVSIGGAVRHEADRNRVAELRIRSKESDSLAMRIKHWDSISPWIDKIDRFTGRKLIARTWDKLPEILAPDGWMRTFRRAASQATGNARSGDQYGVLCCGAWSLLHDHAPSYEEALDFVGPLNLPRYVLDNVPDAVRCLEVLLEQQIRVESLQSQALNCSVGELVESVRRGLPIGGSITSEDADRTLRRVGLRVGQEGGVDGIYVATKSTWIHAVLRGTPYADGWGGTLRGLPGAVTPPNVIRFLGSPGPRRAVWVPIPSDDY